MIGPAVAGRGIAVPGKDYLGFQFRGTRGRGVKVINLEPKQNAVAVRFGSGIADGAVVVRDFPGMQLQHEFSVVNQALVFAAAVRALAAEEFLKPATTDFDIIYANEGLWMHRQFSVQLSRRFDERRANAGLGIALQAGAQKVSPTAMTYFVAIEFGDEAHVGKSQQCLRRSW